MESVETGVLPPLPPAGQEWFADRFSVLQRNVESFFKGKPDVVRLALVCLLSEGHLLIDDVPGVG